MYNIIKMDFNTILRVSCVFILIYICLVFLEKKLLFACSKYDSYVLKLKFDVIQRKYNVPVKEHYIKTNHNKIYTVTVGNNNKYLIYSCGNAGNINMMIADNQLLGLLDKYTLVFYDYSGYGKTTGSPSFSNLSDDLYNVFRYIEKKTDCSNILLYGHSLGVAITTNVCKRLVDENKFIHGMVLDSGFISLKETVHDLIHPLLKYLVISDVNNMDNLKYINGKIKVLIIHPKDDTMIKIRHAKELCKCKNSKLVITDGFHGYNIYQKDLKYEIETFFNE